MSENTIFRLSKFLSLVLRHKPQKIHLTLDSQGWADVDALLAGMRRAGFVIDRPLLERVVAENDKKRFAFSPDGQKIRASQGHSIEIDLALEPVLPPETLYHGTATRFLASILENGLVPGNRQHVHLSADRVTARTVGSRHGVPVILAVHAQRMHLAGYLFYRSENGVWLTGKVPPAYLVLLEEQPSHA